MPNQDEMPLDFDINDGSAFLDKTFTLTGDSHIGEKTKKNRDVWAGWEELRLLTGVQISAANAPDGAMHVLIRDTYGIIWHGREKEQGLGWNWKSHSGDASKNISELGHFELVCHARDGRMVALAVGTDKAIWDYWYRPEDESLPWSWKSLGGITGRDVRICERRTGGLEAFIVDPCNRLWHRWTTPDHAWCQKWSIMGGRIIGNVAVENNSEGFPQVFARGPDGGIWVRRHRNDSKWNGWTALNGLFQGDPAAVLYDRQINVFAAGVDGKLYCSLQRDLDYWEDWCSLEGCVSGTPVPVVDRSGELELFSQGWDGRVWYIKHRKDEWTKWQTLGGNVTSILVGRHRNGCLSIFACSSNQKVYFRTQSEDGWW
jgi:hypothetical protein